jgi:hypothetical protein
MEGRARMTFRVLALAALLMLVLVVGACGDSDDDGGDGKAAASQSRDGVDPASFDDSPTGQLRLSYAQFIDAFYGKDAQEACGLMSRRMQQKLASEMKRKRDRTCEARLDAYFQGGDQPAKDRPKVVRIKFDGERALAVTQVKGSAKYPIPFVKQDGKWRIDGGWFSG